MRVLICGGRNFKNKKLFHKIMNEIDPATDKQILGDPDLVIIHGACSTGADKMADEYIVVHCKNFEAYPANWDKYFKAGGPIRNQQMIDEGKPDLVVAFPGGKGTANMIRLAKKANIPVREILDV